MRFPHLSSHLLTLTLAIAATFPLRAETAATSRTLIDFTAQDVERDGSVMKAIKRYDYAFDGWKDKVVFLDGKGLLVPFLPGKGGLGGDKRIDFGADGAAEVVIVIGNRNEADACTVTFIDRDGTEASWYLPLKGKPRGALLVCDLNLERPDKEEKPGKTPGLDKRKIVKWQFKGNWQEPKTEVLLVKLAMLKLPQ